MLTSVKSQKGETTKALICATDTSFRTEQQVCFTGFAKHGSFLGG